MNPIYNATYLRGLAISRMRLDELGRIVEAEGYDGLLRHWTYRAVYAVNRFLSADWTWE